MEEESREAGLIYIHCGLISRSIRMKFDDFVKLEKPIIVNCSKSKVEKEKEIEDVTKNKLPRLYRFRCVRIDGSN